MLECNKPRLVIMTGYHMQRDQIRVGYVGYRLIILPVDRAQVMFMSFDRNMRGTYSGFLRNGRIFDSPALADKYAEKYFKYRRTVSTYYEFYIGKIERWDTMPSIQYRIRPIQ